MLEQDLGVTRPAFKRNLVRSMQWKLWGMGEEPAAPTGLRAANASSSCGAVSLDWDQTSPSNSRLSFPVHKYVLRRAPLGPEGERDGGWVTVMAGPNGAFFDAGLRPGAAYRYALQAWNALGHSSSVEIDVVVATEDCALGGSWFWSPGGGGRGGADSAEASLGGLVLATAVSVAAAFCFRALGGSGGGGGSEEGRRRKTSARSSSPRGFDRGSNGGSSSGGVGSGSSTSSRREEVDRRRRPEARLAVAGTATGKSAVSDGSAAGGNGRGAGSPTRLGRSGGSGRGDADREMIEQPRRRLSGSGVSCKPSSSSARLVASSKEGLRRSSSDVTAAGRGAKAAAAAAAAAASTANGGGGITGRLSSARSSTGASVGESVRKERARRLQIASRHHSSSRDEREVCKECYKEWRW